MFPNFPALKDFLAFWEKITRRTPIRGYRCALEPHKGEHSVFFQPDDRLQFLSLALQRPGIEEGFVCIRVQF
jgi:hypothetical protein